MVCARPYYLLLITYYLLLTSYYLPGALSTLKVCVRPTAAYNALRRYAVVTTYLLLLTYYSLLAQQQLVTRYVVMQSK